MRLCKPCGQLCRVKRKKEEFVGGHIVPELTGTASELNAVRIHRVACCNFCHRQAGNQRAFGDVCVCVCVCLCVREREREREREGERKKQRERERERDRDREREKARQICILNYSWSVYIFFR